NKVVGLAGRSTDRVIDLGVSRGQENRGGRGAEQHGAYRRHHPVHSHSLILDSKVSGVYTRPALKREETMTRFALVRSSTLIGVLIVGMMVGSAAATFLAAQQPAAQQPQPPAAQPPAQPAGRGQGAAAEPPAPCGPQAQLPANLSKNV